MASSLEVALHILRSLTDEQLGRQLQKEAGLRPNDVSVAQYRALLMQELEHSLRPKTRDVLLTAFLVSTATLATRLAAQPDARILEVLAENEANHPSIDDELKGTARKAAIAKSARNTG